LKGTRWRPRSTSRPRREVVDDLTLDTPFYESRRPVKPERCGLSRLFLFRSQGGLRIGHFTEHTGCPIGALAVFSVICLPLSLGRICINLHVIHWSSDESLHKLLNNLLPSLSRPFSSQASPGWNFPLPEAELGLILRCSSGPRGSSFYGGFDAPPGYVVR
jgi:hypothetical protein